MDLMKATTTYTQLETKYSGFSRPEAEILVDGTKMAGSLGMEVTELVVDLTSGYEASGCEFSAGGCYVKEDKDFDSSISNKLQPGAKVEVQVGYGDALESVFTGYINTVTHEFPGDEPARIHVSCMDAKGLLMKNRRLETFQEKKADAIVKSLLSEQPVSYFLSGKVVDACTQEEVPLRSGMKTDYDIIVEQAGKVGFEFFILQGKAYFRKEESNSTPIMTLEPCSGVRELYSGCSVNRLVESVEVRSINQQNGKVIKGSAKLSGSFGKGSGASKTYRSTAQVFYEPGVSSPSEASKRAEARMNALKAHFGSLEIRCVGIPELAPGRFLSIAKFSGMTNGKYYITAVKHQMGEDGFWTSVQARRKSL